MKGLWLQGLRFVAIGMASNVVLYLLYLLLTTIGIGYKTAMTLLFVVGTLQTFVFNRRWTFAHQGSVQVPFMRYVVVYSLAYILNLAALLVFVDHFSLPHQIVQGVMILLLAVMLFFLQKVWVFRVPTPA